MPYVKLTGTKNPHSDWTSVYQITDKTVERGVPINLTADERKEIEALGGVFEDSSAEEAREFEENTRPDESIVGSDVVASPRISAPDQVNQPEVDKAADQPSSSKADKNSK